MWSHGIRIPFRNEKKKKRNKLSDEPELGATNNVVLRLARVIPRMRYHVVFFDNFYTSLPQAWHLSKQEIHCVGSAYQRRLFNCRLADKKNVMKTTISRGSYEKRISYYNDVNFSATMWEDKKVLTF